MPSAIVSVAAIHVCEVGQLHQQVWRLLRMMQCRTIVPNEIAYYAWPAEPYGLRSFVRDAVSCYRAWRDHLQRSHPRVRSSLQQQHARHLPRLVQRRN